MELSCDNCTCSKCKLWNTCNDKIFLTNSGVTTVRNCILMNVSRDLTLAKCSFTTTDSPTLFTAIY